MSLYALSFGFRQPYQALGVLLASLMSLIILTWPNHTVDSEMCKDAISHKIELVKQLSVVLQGSVKPSMFYPTSLADCPYQGHGEAGLSDHAMLYSRAIPTRKVSAICC